MAQRAECQIQVADVLGSMVTGVYLIDFFVFIKKTYDVNIAIIANFG